MTLPEKIAQMLMIELFIGSSQSQQAQDVSPVASIIQQYGIGAVLGGGNSFWPMGSTTIANLITDMQSASEGSRNKIPVLFGIDAVHGNALIRGSTIFPHNIGVGCSQDMDLAHDIARTTAKELRACGFHIAFAPCVALPEDVRWGRTYEGYSVDADIVSNMTVATVKGLQDGPHQILACPKHFVGDGATTYGTENKTRC